MSCALASWFAEIIGVLTAPCTVQTYNTLKVRFSATLGEEPEGRGGPGIAATQWCPAIGTRCKYGII
jgi:hypothetical protein